jgi:hypothetical protein
MGWAAYQLNWIRQRHEFISKFHHMPPNDGEVILRMGTESDTRPPDPPWNLRIFGEEGFVWWHIEETQLPRLRQLFPEFHYYKDRFDELNGAN